MKISSVALRSLPVLASELRGDIGTVLLALVREVSLLDADGAARLVFESKIVIVHHTNRKINRILLEVDDQGLAIEVAVLIGVHLDALVAICALVNDAVLLERVLDLVGIRIARKVGNVNRTILLDLGLLANLCNVSSGLS